MALHVRGPIIAVASLVLCSAAPARSHGAEALAIVSALKGKVEVIPAHSKQSQRASFGLALQRGDRVAVGHGSSATLFFSDGNVIELGEQSSVTIGARVDKPTRTEIPSQVFAQVSTFVTGGSRQTGLVALSSMRGEDAGVFLLRPRKTSVLDARPAFAWRSVPGATRYVVKASTEDGTLWSREIADTVMAYPPDAAPLPAETDVLWEVEARAASGRLRSETTFLRVLAPASGDEIRRGLEGIDASLGRDSAAANFLAGSYLSASGLHQDAIERFAALCRSMPDAPGPHQSLGRAYASVGLLDLATAEYERALELSREP